MTCPWPPFSPVPSGPRDISLPGPFRAVEFGVEGISAPLGPYRSPTEGPVGDDVDRNRSWWRRPVACRTRSAPKSLRCRAIDRTRLLARGIIPLLLSACTNGVWTPPPGLTAAEWQRLMQAEPAVVTIDESEGRTLLEQPSRPVLAGAPWLGRLTERMTEAAHRHRASGLAAVQLGIPVRVVVLHRRAGLEEWFEAFVDPELTAHSSERLASFERCLSLPWGYRFTERPARVTVRYRNLAGAVRYQTLIGEDAVVFQHELDHLEGRLLSRGVPRRSFIPALAMESFMAGIDRDCREAGASACPAVMRAHWEAHTKRPSSESR